MSGQHRDVVIIGAGIGGLTAAVALQRAGVSVRVLEQAPELRPVGAGLTLQPNALLALRELGLGQAVESVGQSLQIAEIRDIRDRRLSGLSAAQAAALLDRVGAPALGIHRASLHDILLAEAGDVVSLGVRVTGLSGAGVQTSDGRVGAPLIVGADGINSVIRGDLWGVSPPRYSGYFCWRGVTAESPFPGDWAGEYWGRGRRFGGCAIDGGRFYWFAVADGPPGGTGPIGTEFADFPPRVRAAIAATDPASVLRADISDRDPLPEWGSGPVTLLGDAAHAMTPNLGQGACQAIEDALVLGSAITRHGLQPTALRSYESARQKRANAIVRRARLVGDVAQAKGALTSRARDLLARVTPYRAVSRQFEELWTLPDVDSGE